MIGPELLTAISLGLIGGVIPGPVLTAIFTEILQSGYARSLRIIIIAFVVESLVAVISLLVFSSIGLNEVIFRSLSIAGAGILIWISTSLWKIKTLDSGQRVVFSLWKITIMILSNGVLWTYWITICIPKAVFLSQHLSFGDYLFMGMVQAGWLISTIIISFIFSKFRELLSRPGIIPVVFKIFSVVFIYFALDMLWESIRFFFQNSQV